MNLPLLTPSSPLTGNLSEPVVRLILVGGFLGAGKTTLLRQAGHRLVERGLRVGLITNDQAAGLVDTEVLRRDGFDVAEVSGGCFCCRLSELLSTSRNLLERHRPDVLLCEPVGSCTDLAATVLLPLQRLLSSRFRVAPFSVLVDPARLRELLDKDRPSPFTEKVLYIYSKQLEEADWILLNKSDRSSQAERAGIEALLKERFPRAKRMHLSARTGAGVGDWLENVFTVQACERKAIQVDYDVYAEGEAQLGWLNATVKLHSARAVPWKPMALSLLRALKDRFRVCSAEVAHVKVALTAQGNALLGSLTSTKGRPFLLVQGAAEEPARDALLLLNARVQLDPEVLKDLVTQALDSISREGLEISIEQLVSFRPARPVPEQRDLPAQECPMDETKVCGVVRNMFRPKRGQAVTGKS